jgi:hypothetical protein
MPAKHPSSSNKNCVWKERKKERKKERLWSESERETKVWTK